MAGLNPRLQELINRRDSIGDKAAEEYRGRLQDLSDNLGRRLAASLGVDPSIIAEEDGDDGSLVGRTDFERRLQELNGDAAALRASVLATSYDEIQDLVDAAGMDRAAATLSDSFRRLAGLAEETMIAAGLPAGGVLDTVAAEALLGGFFEDKIADSAGRYSLDTATRIKRGLTSGLTFQSMEDLAKDIHESTGVSVGRATTEARTAIAEADRFTDDIIRQSVDPEGTGFLIYSGPDDGVTRDFCSHLVGKFFTSSQFNKLRNGQGTSPRIMGGGYNCRHRVLPTTDGEKMLKEMGLKRGTNEDIERANDGARRKKKKR